MTRSGLSLEPAAAGAALPGPVMQMSGRRQACLGALREISRSSVNWRGPRSILKLVPLRELASDLWDGEEVPVQSVGYPVVPEYRIVPFRTDKLDRPCGNEQAIYRVGGDLLEVANEIRECDVLALRELVHPAPPRL